MHPTDAMARRKRPSFPPRHESPDQTEEREARITEMMERIRHHNEQAASHQKRAEQHQQEAERHMERAARKKAAGPPRTRKQR